MNVAARFSCGLLVVALAGCDWMLSGLDGDPALCARRPLPRSLTDELVVIRVVEGRSSPEQRLYLDRVRYLESRDSLHSVNRVIIATSQSATVPPTGDTVRVTTEFDRVIRAGGYEFFIPDWSANDGQCFDGAWVALHRIVSIATQPGGGG